MILTNSSLCAIFIFAPPSRPRRVLLHQILQQRRFGCKVHAYIYIYILKHNHTSPYYSVPIYHMSDFNHNMPPSQISESEDELSPAPGKLCPPINRPILQSTHGDSNPLDGGDHNKQGSHNSSLWANTGVVWSVDFYNNKLSEWD